MGLRTQSHWGSGVGEGLWMGFGAQNQTVDACKARPGPSVKALSTSPSPLPGMQVVNRGEARGQFQSPRKGSQ